MNMNIKELIYELKLSLKTWFNEIWDILFGMHQFQKAFTELYELKLVWKEGRE